MKTLLLAGLMTAAFGTACYADQFWVVGNRGTGKCDIVTSNPVVYGLPAYADGGSQHNVSFADGPYRSIDDAKLARSTINACPSEPAAADDEK
jgi:hypothetical protein